MSRGKVTIRYDYSQFNLLRLEAQAELDRMGEQIVAAAGGSPDFEYIPSPNRTRARGIVTTSSLEGERLQATERALSRAIGAAGGADGE